MHPDLITTSVWDDPGNVEMLTRMWTDGASASEIAVAMGQGVTRNAVIGKVVRFKLPKRSFETLRVASATGNRGRAGNPGQTRAKSIVVRRSARDLAEEARQLSVVAHRHQRSPFREGSLLPREEAGVDVTKLIGVVDLTVHTCKWPHGTPGEAGFGFCGAEPVDGKPYCAKHMRRAYHRPAGQ